MAARRPGDSDGAAVNAAGLDWEPPKGKYIQLRSGACFYRESGSGSPPIVLLHGLPVDSRIYGRLQPRLSGRFRTLALDFLGWGLSRPNEGLPFGFDTLDRNLDQFLDAHELDSVVLVAQEMSGPSAIRWAAANPERMHALVLLNTYYGWNSARMPLVLKFLHMPYLGRALRRFVDIGRTGLSWHLYRWQVGHLWSQRSTQTDRILRSFHRVFRHSSEARRAFHAINDDLVKQINSNQRRLDILTDVRCPTLILWGQRDRYLVSSVARQFHRLLPGSELRMIPAAGHLVQMEAPELVAESITEFLDRLEPETPNAATPDLATP